MKFELLDLNVEKGSTNVYQNAPPSPPVAMMDQRTASSTWTQSVWMCWLCYERVLVVWLWLCSVNTHVERCCHLLPPPLMLLTRSPLVAAQQKQIVKTKVDGIHC